MVMRGRNGELSIVCKVWTFKTVDLFLREYLLDTPNLSLMLNKSIFHNRNSSSTVKKVCRAYIFYVGQVT